MTFSSNYRQTTNINHTLVSNKIGEHSDAAGAAPTISSFSTLHMASLNLNSLERSGCMMPPIVTVPPSGQSLTVSYGIPMRD